MKKVKIFFDKIKKENILLGKDTEDVIETICRDYSCILKIINIIFTNDENLKEINNKYLDKDYYTDIITFDLSEKEGVIETEIYISLERVRENSEKYHESFIKELNRVILHGVLHLVGEKDNNLDNQLKMRKKEDFYLRSFT